MSLQNQQSALARLYTDPGFRLQFLADPKEFAHDLGLTTNEAESLAAIAADEVRWFADSLISKRLREVVKKLPLSHAAVGAEAFEESFRQFARNFYPATVKKHLEDAVTFADWLERSDLDASKKALVRFESLRLRHSSLGKTVSVCLLRQDPRTRRTSGIGLWIAFKGWSRIYFRPNPRH